MPDDNSVSNQAGWTTVSSRRIYHSEWLELRRDQAYMPDGTPSAYEHLVVPGSVTVLAVDADGRVAVTRQWIYPHGETQWRLPTGRIDPADSGPSAAARRELREETGISARELRELGRINCADSLTNHREYSFLATGLTTGSPDLEPGESDLEVWWLPFEDVRALVAAGELPHAGSAFAVLAAESGGFLDEYRR